MKTNFDISLPSIPGKTIKFKIQDIKTAAFGSQKARFPDKKSNLTKKFIESFNNFHGMKQSEDEVDTQAETENNKSYVIQKTDIKFRTMVAEHKKSLLPLYNELKQTKTEKQIPDQTNFQGGFTFMKSQKNSMKFDNIKEDYEEENKQKSLTENYYFTEGEKKREAERVKRQKPSAIFKNQTRSKVYARIENSTVPGPGAYLKKKSKTKEKPKERKKVHNTSKQIDQKHLKEVITKILVQVPEEDQEQVMREKNVKNNNVFVLDDRDRFGDQIYPIAPKLNVPGPGSYQVNDSIEDKARKGLIVEEQRKLLKEWFNN